MGKISTVEAVKHMSDKELMQFIKNVHEAGYYQGKNNQPCDYVIAIGLSVLISK